MKIGHVILAIAVLILSTSFKSKLTVNEILEKHVEAMGGTENLEKIKSVHYKLKSRIVISEVAIIEGEEYLSRMKIGTNEYLEYIKDTIAKSCGGGVIKDVSDKRTSQLIGETHIFKLYKAEERGWSFELNKDESNWKYFALEGTNESLNLNATFFIYKRNFLLGFIKGGSFFNSEFKRYIKTSFGVKFPTVINTKGIPFTKAQLTDLEFNKPLNDLSKSFYAKCGGLN